MYLEASKIERDIIKDYLKKKSSEKTETDKPIITQEDIDRLFQNRKDMYDFDKIWEMIDDLFVRIALGDLQEIYQQQYKTNHFVETPEEFEKIMKEFFINTHPALKFRDGLLTAAAKFLNETIEDDIELLKLIRTGGKEDD